MLIHHPFIKMAGGILQLQDDQKSKILFKS